ncbi:MAG: hypothetical protein MJ171_00865 [Clostridia bacterium]|nr:hypothetical protein [Clostridia bacterium]
MHRVLVEQLTLHRSMTAQDIVKMCYQGCFGIEHLISDMEKAKTYFYSEYAETKEEDLKLYEEISEDFVRVNMASWKYQGKDPDDLFRRFIDSAGYKGNADFMAVLDDCKYTLKVLKETELLDDLELFVSAYFKEGLHAVHHSKVYEEKDNPHYRIVLKRNLVNIK